MSEMITERFKLNEETIRYIIHFLIAVKVPDEVYNAVGYTADKDLYKNYNIIINPSLFFHEKIYGTHSNLPILPLKQIEGVPLLYGKPQTFWAGETLIVYADIIASAFFMLSRYEEMVRPAVRDEHGRFPGKESIAGRMGFINRPIVDEYGKILRRWLRSTGFEIPEPGKSIKKIYLTHDLDMPFFCRSWKSVIRELMRGTNALSLLRIRTGQPEADPFYTFPWFDIQARKLQLTVGNKRCKSILFVRAGGSTPQDKPHYKLKSHPIRKLLTASIKNNISIGLHSSYEAGINPGLIAQEHNNLENAIIQPVKYNRHHYLSSRDPRDMEELEKAGITDDFTMGYADVAGFRLGTTRPVRRIDPYTGIVNSLKLHSITVMDCTLNEQKYMDMTRQEAEIYCLDLIDKVKEMNGELVLLWHNNLVTDNPQLTRTVPWLRSLYSKLIEHLMINA